MKTITVIQTNGKDIVDTDIIARIKDIWVSQGNKVKDIKTLTSYIKPDEMKVYYVINETITGSFEV